MTVGNAIDWGADILDECRLRGAAHREDSTVCSVMSSASRPPKCYAYRERPSPPANRSLQRADSAAFARRARSNTSPGSRNSSACRFMSAGCPHPPVPKPSILSRPPSPASNTFPLRASPMLVPVREPSRFSCPRFAERGNSCARYQPGRFSGRRAECAAEQRRRTRCDLSSPICWPLSPANPSTLSCRIHLTSPTRNAKRCR